jgi:CheY-like chemotaxis protein
MLAGTLPQSHCAVRGSTQTASLYWAGRPNNEGSVVTSTCGSLREKAQPSGEHAFSRHTVLIVDDDEALTEVLARRLRRQGFKISTAGCGEAGLHQARAARPSLVVLDLRLPDIDGLTICEQLADSPETCTIPVIILSGIEKPDILRRCRAAGCHYFLRKPYDPNALLLLIREAICQANGWMAT